MDIGAVFDESDQATAKKLDTAHSLRRNGGHYQFDQRICARNSATHVQPEREIPARNSLS